MEDAVNGSAAGGSGPIVVAGAGYAGLHVALRLLLSHADEHDAFPAGEPGQCAAMTPSLRWPLAKQISGTS